MSLQPWQPSDQLFWCSFFTICIHVPICIYNKPFRYELRAILLLSSVWVMHKPIFSLVPAPSWWYRCLSQQDWVACTIFHSFRTAWHVLNHHCITSNHPATLYLLPAPQEPSSHDIFTPTFIIAPPLSYLVHIQHTAGHSPFFILELCKLADASLIFVFIISIILLFVLLHYVEYKKDYRKLKNKST